jgi:hypothetical protein
LEDDGMSYKYEDGIIAKTEFVCDEHKDKITFSVNMKNDYYNTKLTNRVYEIEMFCDKPKKVILNGITLKKEDWNYSNDYNRLTFSFKMNSTKLDIIK